MIFKRLISTGYRLCSSESYKIINNEKFQTDSYTNLTPKIISLLDKKLYLQKEHPICLVKDRIVNFFYKNFLGPRGNPIFSIHDTLNPVVTVEQNFDSLLVPTDHPSRAKGVCYYINRELLLRAHMTAHQFDLIKMGFDNFLMVGDVYRRDSIDVTHYPVFHQLDGVRLFTPSQLFGEKEGTKDLKVVETQETTRTKEKQENYTVDATFLVEKELKSTLEKLTRELFGEDIQFRWVEAYFPFTHPSWELEILINDKWIEMLGCGVMENKILKNGGCGDKIGWAFGLGLERLTMVYYGIPDIRLFWTTDSGFHCQFKGKSYLDKFKYKPVSVFPQNKFDISFWITEKFSPSDFYNLAREVCDDIVEQIELIDNYKCKKTGKESYCFRITYRSLFKTLTNAEVRKIHLELEEKVTSKFNVIVR